MAAPHEEAGPNKGEVLERHIDGIYLQSGGYQYVMIRIKGPGSRWSAEALQVISQIATHYGDNTLHLTTRGDIELHGIPLAQIDEVLEWISAHGLTTRGACGDTVRNVSACVGSGSCPYERIPAAPIAQEIAHVCSSTSVYEQLPRKFKISVSGCERGCALPQIQDIGVVAHAWDAAEEDIPCWWSWTKPCACKKAAAAYETFSIDSVHTSGDQLL